MIPENHPQRFELNDEVHARPPESLAPPLRLSFLALYTGSLERDGEWRRVSDLAQRFGVAPPRADANHFSADLGPFRLKWERHTEFTRYKFIVDGLVGEDPFATPAIATVPADWVAALPGRTLVATHAVLVAEEAWPHDDEVLASRFFAGNPLVGATIAGGGALAYTDFRIHGDGFSRLLVLDRTLTRRQAGRMMQRLLEIDTYRMMALLALPTARALAPVVTRGERDLADVTTVLANASDADEPVLLDRLTRLEAEIGSQEAATHYRFAAASAYYDLVKRRIEELREERLQGLQTFGEFMERRLAPAMNTCRAVALRQESLSRRVAGATQLLSTRVDITTERQNQAVLESMNRRAGLQLRLQQTVEGLSVAAVTYYVVGLVGYAAKGLKAGGLPIDPELAMGVSIPIVLAIVALGLRRFRKSVAGAATGRRA